MDNVAVIPARYGSTRFKGKVLACIRGKPMVQHVYERALRSKSVSRVLVATDDERVVETVRRSACRYWSPYRNWWAAAKSDSPSAMRSPSRAAAA